MNNRLDETLREVAERTFESLVFMLPMPAMEVSSAGEPAVAVSIGFSGPSCGRLFLMVSGGMLPELAVNMLGMEDDQDAPSPEQQNDALKELANVICGNLLPEIAGTEAEFNVGAPQLLSDGVIPQSHEGLAPIAQVQLYLDSGNAELAFFCEEPIAAAAGDGEGQSNQSQPQESQAHD